MSLHDFFASHPVFSTEELAAQKRDKTHIPHFSGPISAHRNTHGYSYLRPGLIFSALAVSTLQRARRAKTRLWLSMAAVSSSA